MSRNNCYDLFDLLLIDHTLSASFIKMGKVTKNISKKLNDTQQNSQNKNKRKGRPPKKKKGVQKIEISNDDTLSVRQASTRSRVIPIRGNEIPMHPEIHIAPASDIPSSNNSSNIQQSSSNKQVSSQDGQVNEPQLISTATSLRLTITMTSVTINNVERSNTTTYVTTEILPMKKGLILLNQII
jgi:hypothetical protein